jgi:hypothetical protein
MGGPDIYYVRQECKYLLCRNDRGFITIQIPLLRHQSPPPWGRGAVMIVLKR